MNMALSSITTSKVPDGRDDSLCDLNPPGNRNSTVRKFVWPLSCNTLLLIVSVLMGHQAKEQFLPFQSGIQVQTRAMPLKMLFY